ncbi:hypothetical protein CRD60_04250 [Bifidobacterium aemilianum]|uniref:Uncharacterized protein n=1 Tax=Bifidobacterium aemilianum TaxID=2493120 RepID=A0A366K996_9BIFI|nr:hypothetical protein CRD60_04250 [Bifidobacterium aemilianum]
MGLDVQNIQFQKWVLCKMQELDKGGAGLAGSDWPSACMVRGLGLMVGQLSSGRPESIKIVFS